MIRVGFHQVVGEVSGSSGITITTTSATSCRPCCCPCRCCPCKPLVYVVPSPWIEEEEEEVEIDFTPHITWGEDECGNEFTLTNVSGDDQIVY